MMLRPRAACCLSFVAFVFAIAFCQSVFAGDDDAVSSPKILIDRAGSTGRPHD